MFGGTSVERLRAELPLRLRYNTDTITLLWRPKNQEGPGMTGAGTVATWVLQSWLMKEEKKRSPFTFEGLPGYGAAHAPVHGRCSPSPRSCQPSFIQEQLTFEVNKTHRLVRETDLQLFKEYRSTWKHLPVFLSTAGHFYIQRWNCDGIREAGLCWQPLLFISGPPRLFIPAFTVSPPSCSDGCVRLQQYTHFTCTPAVLRVGEQQKCSQIKFYITLNKKEYFKRFVPMCKLFTCDGYYTGVGCGATAPPRGRSAVLQASPGTALRIKSP